MRISSAALLVKVTASTPSSSCDVLGDEIGDAMRDDARLPRSRAGENQQRPVRVRDGRCCSGFSEEGNPSRSLGSALASPDCEPMTGSDDERSGETCLARLFYRHRLREIARLIDIAAATNAMWYESS